MPIATPELLAPAGSPESLAAAIANGADAVYLGGSLFSARANAANFDRDEMIRAVRLAHLHGVKVYVAVNTLLDPSELRDALSYLRFLYEEGADAVIVQDLGLVHGARTLLPHLPLHASTQMTIHNEWGARFLRELGLERVVLAREVSLSEAAQIRERSGLPIETFAHGALCFSYSGQCLLSSMIGGRSGNRGRCAQPCRLEYSLVDGRGKCVTNPAGGKHLLSPSDLNTLEILPLLHRAGVQALKIEGRMKRPEYVATVVRVYRQALDRMEADPDHYRAAPDELRDLEQIFNRGFTTGYFEGRPGARMMSYQRPNNRGILLGRIAGSVRSGWYSVRLEQPLHVGDGVEVWVTRGGRVGTEVSELRAKGADRTGAAAGEVVELPLPGRPRPGDRVFKTSDAGLLERATLSYAPESPSLKIEVRLRFSAAAGRPPELWLEDEEGHGVHVIGAFVTEPAVKHALTPERVREQLTRLGGTAFHPVAFDADIKGDVMVPVSELNAMRRRAVELLEQSRLAAFTRPPVDPDFDARLDQLISRTPGRPARPCVLSATVSDPASLDAAVSGGVGRVYFGGETFRPAGIWTRPMLDEGIRLAHRAGAKAVISLPRIMAQRETAFWERWLEEALALRPDGVLIRNPGQLPMLKRCWDGPLMADYPVNIFNHLAVEALEGLSLVTLSPELMMTQVEQISGLIAGRRPDVEIEAVVHGRLTLMVSEHCPIGALAGGGAGEQGQGCTGPCERDHFMLKDRLGLTFPMRTDAFCRMHLFNSMDLSMLSDVRTLAGMGLSCRIEGIAHGPDYLRQVAAIYRDHLAGRIDQAEMPSAVQSLEGLSPQGTTRGHYYRGV